MTSDRQVDYVRTDELDDAIVPLEWLPGLFGVTDRTIRNWVKSDSIVTFPNPLLDTRDGQAKEHAIRWGDIPFGTHPRRWKATFR